MALGLRERLRRVHTVLDRHGLVKRKTKRRYWSQGTASLDRPSPTNCGVEKFRVQLGVVDLNQSARVTDGFGGSLILLGRREYGET